jgi:hypothetical protein
LSLPKNSPCKGVETMSGFASLPYAARSPEALPCWLTDSFGHTGEAEVNSSAGGQQRALDSASQISQSGRPGCHIDLWNGEVLAAEVLVTQFW